MPAQVSSTQFKALLTNLTTGKTIALFILLTGTVICLVLFAMWAGKPDFHLLYSNLSPEDAGAILTKLKDQKIPYRISANGSSVLVPGERVYETRLELASQGLPQGSGVGFEIFDNTKLGMTEFVQNVNYQRACQGELSRTINGFAEIESSRVHIVMPSKSLFIEEEKPASASVVLKLSPGRKLTKNQVQGIVHLVSSSISGLSPENVTIVDNYGKMLAGFKEKSATGKIGSDQVEFQEKLERNSENKIKTMLEAALGLNKAIVRVSCLLDFKKYEKTEEKYQPDNKVIRSEQVFNETSKEKETTPAGIPGVTSKISPGNIKADTAGGNPEFNKQDRTVNYEIGKVISHTVEPVGNIIRLSVAVIVDGTYKLMKSKTGKNKKEEWKYFPRTSDEMEKLENIVKRAVNFSAKRGDSIEVINIPFETTRLKLAQGEEYIITEKSWLSTMKQYSHLIRYIVSGIFFLFIFIFLVRPMIRWITSGSVGNAGMINQLPKTVSEIEREYASGQKSLPFRDLAANMITSDSKQSAHLMREWIQEKKD